MHVVIQGNCYAPTHIVTATDIVVAMGIVGASS
jgi:hypothetical protein